MILVARVLGTGVRLEKIVAGRQFEGHARRAPNVGRGVVSGSDNDLQATILTRLDVLCEMTILLSIGTE